MGGVSVAGPGTAVTILLTVADGEGRVLDDLHARTPLVLPFGRGCAFPGLMAGLSGLAAGDEADIFVPRERAFGERRPERVIRVRISELPDRDMRPGDTYRYKSPDGGERVYTVSGRVGDRLVLDENPPWAGMDLVYKVRVLSVDPARRFPGLDRTNP